LDYISDSSEENDSDYDFIADERSEILDEEEILQKVNPVIDPWKKTLKNLRKKDWLPKFKCEIGPYNCNLSSESSPYEFFKLIFDEDLMCNLMDWTNAKAGMKIDNHKRRKKKKLYGVTYPLKKSKDLLELYL